MGHMLARHFSFTQNVLSNRILKTGSPYAGQPVYYRGWWQSYLQKKRGLKRWKVETKTYVDGTNVVDIVLLLLKRSDGMWAIIGRIEP